MSGQAVVRTHSRSHSIAYCAVSIACMAVTAWVTVPIGPVPLSLAPLAIYFTLFAFQPSLAFASICGYVLLGALGLPVFTGFRGGLGAVFGPTGGFIMGYVVASFAALLVSSAMAKRSKDTTERSISLFGSKVKRSFFFRSLIVGIVFLILHHFFGVLWLAFAGQLDISAAFLAASAPFIIPDLLKMLLAIFLAQAVGAARKKSGSFERR